MARGLAWPGDDHKLHHCGQCFCFPPFWERCDMVGTNEIKQSDVRKSLMIVSNRIHRERHASPTEFLVIHLISGFSSQGQSEHFQAFRCGGWNLVWLERGLRGWNEDELIQLEFLTGGLRYEKMAQMNGIERAPIKAQRLPRSSLRIGRHRQISNNG